MMDASKATVKIIENPAWLYIPQDLAAGVVGCEFTPWEFGETHAFFEGLLGFGPSTHYICKLKDFLKALEENGTEGRKLATWIRRAPGTIDPVFIRKEFCEG